MREQSHLDPRVYSFWSRFEGRHGQCRQPCDSTLQRIVNKEVPVCSCLSSYRFGPECGFGCKRV